MDAQIAAAARALAAGDALGGLRRVALRDDAAALALRGIALAQLGEYAEARALLRRAVRGFGRGEAAARARCVVAEAEIALALRDLGADAPGLAQAAAVLDGHGEHANARHARVVALRRWLLLGRIDEAQAALATLGEVAGPPPLAALAALGAAELAWRSLRMAEAEDALARAAAAAALSRIPALQAEVAEARAALARPAARRVDTTGAQPLRLAEVAALLDAGHFVVDAGRRGLRATSRWLPLAGRPVLFALVRALAAAWPADVPRDALIAAAFRQRVPDETHRARLRVEIGRLRGLLAGWTAITATSRGYALRTDDARPVVLLEPLRAGEHGALEALLGDGAAWSTAALAHALGASQRQVQRGLAELAATGRARAIGRSRAQRWLAPPLADCTTILLLPSSLTPD